MKTKRPVDRGTTKTATNTWRNHFEPDRHTQRTHGITNKQAEIISSIRDETEKEEFEKGRNSQRSLVTSKNDTDVKTK